MLQVPQKPHKQVYQLYQLEKISEVSQQVKSVHYELSIIHSVNVNVVPKD